MLHNLHSQNKAEQQLVALKEAAAYVHVQAVGEVLVQQLYPLCNGVSLQAQQAAFTGRHLVASCRM